MAGIDELHFEAILDDKKFMATIEADKKAAQDLNTTVSNILTIRSRVNNTVAKQEISNLDQTLKREREKKRVAEEWEAIKRRWAENLAKEQSREEQITENIRKRDQAIARDLANKEKIAALTQETAKAEQTHAAAVEQTNVRLMSTRSLISTISQLTGVYFGAMGIRRFLSSMIEVTGQFEVQKMALRTMLKDIDGADRLFEQLYQFSSDSTYRFSELAKHAKQLAGFGIGKDNLLETTKMLGDVASGLGISMDRIILAYGHVKSSGFLRGIQLRSFAQNGVPVLEELAKILTEAEGKAVSLGEVFDRMTKREIPFEMVEEAFRRMTSEGGKFYQMQEVLSKTLAGQINILKGRWENLMYAIGDSQSGLLKGVVSSISGLLKNYEDLGRKLREIILAWGIYQGTIIAAELATNSFVLANHRLLASLSSVLTALSSNPYTALAIGVTAVVAALYKLGTSLETVSASQAAFDEEFRKFKKSVAAEQSELDYLYAKLKLLKEGTEDYATAKRELETRFGTYIDQLRDEGREVDNLASLYENLTAKINDAQLARFIENATKRVNDTYANSIDVLLNNTGQKEWFTAVQMQAELNLNAFERAGLDMMVLGNKTKEELRNMKEYASLFEKIDKGYVHTGGGDSGPMKASKFLDVLIAKGAKAKEEFTTARETIEDYAQSLLVLGDKADKTDVAEVPDWVNKVTKALSGASEDLKRAFSPKENEDYFAYLSRMGKEYKEINEYHDKALEKDKQAYKAQLKVIKAIDRSLEGNILSDVRVTKTPWKSSGDEESDIKDLKDRIGMYEKLRDAYRKLEPYLGADTPTAMAKIFHGEPGDFTLDAIDESILSLTDDLKSLGEEGQKAAEIILNRLGLDAVSQMVKKAKEMDKAQKALEKYQKMVRDWQAKDFNLSGSGFLYDINKILTDYNTALAKVDNKYTDAVKKAEEAHKGNAEAIAEEIKELSRLRDAEKGYVKAQMQEKLGGLAKKIVDEAYQGNGIDLKNLGSASLGRLNDLLGKLRELRDTGGLIPEDMIDKINEAGFTVEGLMESINSVINSDISRGLDVRMRRLQRSARSTVNILTEIGERMQTIGEITASGLVESLGEALQLAGKIGDIITSSEAVMNSMSEGMENIAQSNDWITMLVKIALLWIDTIITAVQSSAETAARAEDAIRDSIIAVRDAKAAAAETIIGESWTKRIRAEAENLRDAAEEYYRWLVFYEMYAMSNPNPDVHSNWDNPDFLINYYDNLKGYYDEFTERSKAFAKSIEEIFGDLASSIADQMVDAFVKTGDAMTDLSDSFNDLKKVIYKTFAQDILIDWFKNSGYISILTNLTSAYATGDLDEVDYATRLNKVLGEIQDILTSRVDLINQIGEALGLANVEAEKADSASLGKGIQSITEDTANLLASYINAMRADLSYIRLMQEGGWQDVKAIREAMSLGQAPNYNEYMAQIAANTFDTAQATNDILLELRSVIGSGAAPGSGVRVYIQ